MPETGVGKAHAVIAEAVEDTIETAKRLGKRGSDAAEEFVDDTMQRIKRHPLETVMIAFAAGFVAGGFLCWMAQRK